MHSVRPPAAAHGWHLHPPQRRGRCQTELGLLHLKRAHLCRLLSLQTLLTRIEKALSNGHALHDLLRRIERRDVDAVVDWTLDCHQ